MNKIGIVGGSQDEIKEFVKKAQEKYKNKLEFHIFDTAPDIGSKDLWTYYHYESPEEMALAAVKKAHNKEIDIIVKGIVSTHLLLKAVLNKEYSLKEQDVLSHVAVVELPDIERKLLLTDAAMNIEPTTEQLINITNNAMKAAHNMGKNHPKIALLSSAENYNPKMPSSVLAKEVTDHFAENNQAIVNGPLSLDWCAVRQ
ncbi:phosphate acyltransferase [Tetragenococcus halophilus]|uniref:phosphate acyltransferase n=1 Tax=Tetragenococcus halophilus TaxID=51669 RepID=UPI0030F15A71